MSAHTDMVILLAYPFFRTKRRLHLQKFGALNFFLNRKPQEEGMY
jgi:hypothetical protein